MLLEHVDYFYDSTHRAVNIPWERLRSTISNKRDQALFHLAVVNLTTVFQTSAN